MALDPNTRIRVEAELRLGKSPMELAEKYSINYQSIISWKKQLINARVDEDINVLAGADEITIHALAEEIRELPIISDEERAKQLAVVEAVSGLKRLEEKTRELSFSILQDIETILAEEREAEKRSLKTLKEAAGIVATLHTALFSKNVTQVNVLNTNVSGEKREIFKASLRG